MTYPPCSRGPKTDACLWHPWLRINRVLRVALERGGIVQVRVEFKRALALRSEIRHAL